MADLSSCYVDTDVIIRLVSGDDPKKQEASAKLFKKVEDGELILTAPDTVIADAVFVLTSKDLYNLPRAKVRDALTLLLRYSNFKIDNKQTLINALDIYVNFNLDFGDCILASIVKHTQNKTIYSYDHDFDKISGIKRKEP